MKLNPNPATYHIFFFSIFFSWSYREKQADQKQTKKQKLELTDHEMTKNGYLKLGFLDQMQRGCWSFVIHQQGSNEKERERERENMVRKMVALLFERKKENGAPERGGP